MIEHRKKLHSAKQSKAAVGIPPWKETIQGRTFLCGLLVVVTLAVFLRVGNNEFVNYDDPDYVTSNSHVQSGLSWENVAWAFRTGFASNWHPLTWLSHMTDCQLFDQRAGAHHIVNLLFHVANSVLLLLLLRCMTGAIWRSAMVAALFALHPLHVESVAWISERKDVLSSFFFLLTIGAYARYAKGSEEGEGAPKPWGWYGGGLLLFGLGLMSKPMLVTVPFVLVLMDYWPLGRLPSGVLSGSGASTNKNSRSTATWLVLEKVPFLILSVASCVITFFVQKKGGAVSPLTSLPIGARISNALISYVRYIAKLFWPENLSVLYPHPGTWPTMKVVGAAALLAAVSGAAIVLSRRRRYLPVGWLWFLGTLVPVIGLVQVGIQSMADRYTYIPLIGLLLMLVWGVSDALADKSWGRQMAAVGAAVALTACAVLSAHQVQYWQNSETLFRRATQVTSSNYLAFNNLGFYLSGKGKVDEAMENYRKALEINPLYEDAQNNLGYALAGRKQYAEAISRYQAALRIRPNHVEVHNNLGNALADTGNIDEAITQYLFVLGQKPDHADAHNNLGIALAMKGKFDEAIGHFHQAIRFKPKYASAHSNLGNALAVQHKLEEAIREYEESLRLKPDDAQAHNNLGNAQAEQGRLAEATVHYVRAIELNSENPEAHFNLGNALARQGKIDEATAHYREALRLRPDYLEAQNQLKAATGK